MQKPLIILVSPAEPLAEICTSDGESVIGSEWESDILDCTRSGDCQSACEYVRDHIGVEFRIVAKNSAGNYENRLATDSELEETARAIYFESESDFSDRATAETYLIWEAANNAANEESE